MKRTPMNDNAVQKPGRITRTLGLPALVVFAIAQASCSQVSVMRGDITGLQKVASQAERNGAIRCAPRELATAKSHLTFAETELDQGFVFKAKAHLDIARANAHAAYDLSPPQKCAERGLDDDTPVVPPPRRLHRLQAIATATDCSIRLI
jgi:OOP family OmpA-OmpF porin